MSFVLIRDNTVDKVYVYNNVTSEAATLLVTMAENFDIFSVHRSDDVYEPSIAAEFLANGEVHECHPVTSDYNAFGESGTFITCAHCGRDMDDA